MKSKQLKVKIFLLSRNITSNKFKLKKILQAPKTYKHPQLQPSTPKTVIKSKFKALRNRKTSMSGEARKTVGAASIKIHELTAF